jgi:predicted ATPase
VLRGDCDRAQQSPYFPVVAALLRFVESEEPTARRYRIQATLTESFGEAISLVPGLRGLSSVASRLAEVRGRDFLPAFTNYEGRAVIAFAKFLTGLARDRLLIIALDDLQWADPETVGLLQYLAGMLDRHRLLIVCTLRSEFLAAGVLRRHGC